MTNPNKGLRTTNRQEIEEVPYGVYVWMNPQGEVYGDEDGNVMNIFCMKGDQRAIRALTEAAKHHGAGEGRPVWWSGRRPVSDEEYEMQQHRESLGLVPDPFDLGAIRDEERARRLRND